MHHFRDEINLDYFFQFDRKWIEDMNWAILSSAAKAIFPVIACHADEYGVSFPGEDTIAALSGRTAKVVRQGIRDLEGFPDYHWTHYLTRRGKRGKRFKLLFPSTRQRGRVFFFHRCIIDGGNWLMLKPAAQALYPVLRYFAAYIPDEDEGLDDSVDFNEQYAGRKWELCSAEIGKLAAHAGLDRSTIRDAMNSLQENFLIEPHLNEDGERAWKVYIFPPKRFKASYLNRRTRGTKR
jgi:hypothetical protein